MTESLSTPRTMDKRTVFSGRTIGLLVASLILFGGIAATSRTFLQSYTMFVLSRQIAFFAIIALAQAVCLVVGGMNLSVGAIGSICTVILGLGLAKNGGDSSLSILPLASLCGLAVGVGAAGLCNRLLPRSDTRDILYAVIRWSVGILVGGLSAWILTIVLAVGGLSGWVAVPVALLCGIGAGLLNGLLITKLKIDSFIVTLSMMFIYMGLRSGISGGTPYQVPLSYTYIGQEGLKGIPYVFIIMALVLGAFGFLYRYTVFGRRMLATGGNLDAARLSGINNDNMIIGANMLSGLLAGLAAALWASEMGSAAPETGDSWLIVSFAVAIIGGTGLTGGLVSPLGIFLGGIIYTLIRHGLIEMKANPYYMNVYIGILILLTISIDRVREIVAKRRS